MVCRWTIINFMLISEVTARAARRKYLDCQWSAVVLPLLMQLYYNYKRYYSTAVAWYRLWLTSNCGISGFRENLFRWRSVKYASIHIQTSACVLLPYLFLRFSFYLSFSFSLSRVSHESLALIAFRRSTISQRKRSVDQPFTPAGFQI